MSKGLKVGLIGGAILLVILVVWYFMKSSGTAASKFTAMPDKDINGFDIENAVPSRGLEGDAQHALDIGAESFLIRGGQAWFKTAKTPIITGTVPGGTLYVKK